MINKIAAMAALLILMVVAALAGDDQGEDDALARVVQRLYPPELAAFTQKHHLVEKRAQAFLKLDIGHTSYVFAAYSDGHLGAVALLERSSGDAYTK